MADSSLTIKDLLELVPRSLRRFSEPSFPLQMANEISHRLDKECDPRWTMRESGLILVDGQSTYKIEDFITSRFKQLKGVFNVEEGEINPNLDLPIRGCHLFNGMIRLPYVPAIGPDRIDFSGTIPAASGSSVNELIDTGSSELGDTSKNYFGLLVKLTHTSNSIVEDRIIRKHTPANNSINPNGNFNSIPAENDTYQIAGQFVILRYTTYFPRYTTLDDTLQVDEIFESLYRRGIVLRYHEQSDKTSSELRFWQQQFELDIERFRAYESKLEPEIDKLKPRELPNLFDL